MCPHNRVRAAARPTSPPPCAGPAQGERTVITVAGRPQAQLGPLDDQAPDLDRLIASGAVHPAPPHRRRGARRRRSPVWTGVRIDRALVELRG